MEMYTQEGEEALLAGAPDFVLDAIDNIDTKVGGRVGGWVRVQGAAPAAGRSTLRKWGDGSASCYGWLARGFLAQLLCFMEPCS